METIFSATCDFLLTHKVDIASKVIASAAYDGLKNVLDFKALRGRIQKFFKEESDVDKYLETICTQEANNASKPQRDIEDAYETVTGDKYDNHIFTEIQEWIEENETALIKISKMEFSNKNGFNIGVQNAKKNIINITGDYKPKKK